MIPPSGAQHDISHGDQRATIVEVGGGLRTYEAAGVPILDGYAEAEQASGGRGQPLMPWPNRLEDGRYEWGGAEQQLPLNETGTNSAIHGLVRWANWTAQQVTEASVTMAYRLHPQPGWPGLLDLWLTYELGDGGLTVTIKAENLGQSEAPFGVGFHPYLSLGAGSVDEMTVRIPATHRLEADERGRPVARHPVDGTSFDYRTPRTIGPDQLDTCFTGLEPDAAAELEVGQSRASLWVDEPFGYLMVFTGDTLSPDRRRRGLAVEPMTCPPNALRTGEALIRLEPGERFQASWGISPRP